MHSHALPLSGDLALLFFASLLGSVHCVGMCGPYVAICTARILPDGLESSRRLLARLLFNAGRLATYVAIGALVGAFGQITLAAAARAHVGGGFSLAAGTAAVLFGLGVAGWIRDPSVLLARLGVQGLIRGGARSAFRARPYVSGVLLGALQGALPCALVYGAASRAAAAGSAGAGAAVMLVFGLGTVPAIFSLVSMGSWPQRLSGWWRWSGLFVVAVGILLILRGLADFDLVRHSAFW